LMSLLIPAHADNFPLAKSLSGKLLDNQYEDTLAKVLEMIHDSENMTITSDGWTNVRGDHIVNFILKAPGRSPLFYKAINTSGLAQNAVAVADSICEVVTEIGVKKISAVITDNAPVMRAAWELIEQRYPTISAYCCAAHGVALHENSKTSKEASKLISYINNHHLVHALFDDKRKEAGITRNLSTTVSTRWYSQYTSLKSLNDAKVAVTRLANEHKPELSKISPKPNSAAVLALIKSEEFWKRLEKFISILEFPTNVIGKF
jgi:Protein of unknown function (DUF 659)